MELDIDATQSQVARLLDPRNNPLWMDEIARIEPIAGESGQAGSTCRLVPKRAGHVFIATVVERALPRELKLSLESSGITVGVTDRLQNVSDRTTKLISEEVFSFRGVFAKALGFLAQRGVRQAHRRHMEAFKRFAEAVSRPAPQD